MPGSRLPEQQQKKSDLACGGGGGMAAAAEAQLMVWSEKFQQLADPARVSYLEREIARISAENLRLAVELG
eukprot:CAMPEP_0115715740 /NCGR_PEP_ID=MMETSP0272-20121206/75960_1 /TAXON_ID=71861 /ORGANISM="Scrippsiella trochoidea, Strain CCMP3099" /LENGTH=70 /DNA_ID=CAMNT_0003158025 /DNA_START=29 /DNA_END=237 /DNA_ORIENTATION=+